jgi:exopolysaccharide biosynthesis polyprenyl glycosylphosphotransferase
MSDVLWKEAGYGVVTQVESQTWPDGEGRTTGYEASKRALDITLTGLGLLVLSPFFILLAIMIRMDSPGPVLFTQTRIGRSGEPFRCWKFRSMFVDAEQRKSELLDRNEMAGGTTFKMKQDPRITRVGRLIRRASIDELPQLWNVLVGDMSLVGPRPPLPQEVAGYTAHEKRRLAVKPGITCIWQVSGRSDIPFQEQVLLDIEYIEKRSFWLDLALLVRTIPAVLLARGAY